MKPAVIIVAPPWPRSGTSRVIQNQIEYYRSRGYLTVLIGVAIQGNYVRNSAVWGAFKEGAAEFGADYVLIAALDPANHVFTQLKATLEHGLRGTRLDWIIDIGTSAQLPKDDIRLLGQLPVALIHVNHVFTLGFALRMRKKWIRASESVPLIVETHDVQSHLLKENDNRNPWTHRRDRLERLVESEIRLLQKADVLVHLSVDDFSFYEKQLPHKAHFLTMPTINEALIFDLGSVAASPAADAIDLLFVGQYTSANCDALDWFLRRVWSLIANQGYTCRIVGAVEGMVRSKQPELYSQYRSCFVGAVADLAPYYRAARCVIAPMMSGTGISIKTIEALALGKPFVGTSKAFRGMPMERIEGAGLRAHDDPQDFADAIVEALRAERLAGSTSRAAYESVFSLEASFASRDAAVEMATRTANSAKLP